MWLCVRKIWVCGKYWYGVFTATADWPLSYNDRMCQYSLYYRLYKLKQDDDKNKMGEWNNISEQAIIIWQYVIKLYLKETIPKMISKYIWTFVSSNNIKNVFFTSKHWQECWYHQQCALQLKTNIGYSIYPKPNKYTKGRSPNCSIWRRQRHQYTCNYRTDHRPHNTHTCVCHID